MFGRSFHAGIVDGKKEFRKRFERALEFRMLSEFRRLYDVEA